MKNLQSLLFLFFLMLNTNLLFSQTVEILYKSNKQFALPSDDFAYIEPKADSTKFELVATIKATSKNKKDNIETLYTSILIKAKSIGANCFKLHYYTINDSTKIATLILDTYFGDDSTLNNNFTLHEKNAIFIFCNDKVKETETFGFKVNGEKKQIKSGTFYKAIIEEGKEVKISKGGFTGMTMWYSWEKDKPCTFLTLTSFGVGAGLVPFGTVGLTFNTGRFYPINGDLGTLLTQLYKENK